MAWWCIPGGIPGWGGNNPGLNRAKPELDNDVGYGPRKPAVVMGYPGGPFLERENRETLHDWFNNCLSVDKDTVFLAPLKTFFQCPAILNLSTSCNELTNGSESMDRQLTMKIPF